jgi:solute carrier family 13 (sodium-dependent dicarboxylate transporter), member 2/3/5
MSSTPARHTSPIRSGLCFGLAVALLLIILLLPEPAPTHTDARIVTLTAQGKASLAVLALAVVLWVTEAIPFAITGLFSLSLLVITRVASFKDLIRDGFGNQIIAFFLGVLIFSAAIAETPLLRRMAAYVLYRLGHSASLIILAFLTVGALLSGWITDMAVAAMLLPLGVSILNDAGVEPLRSNFGRALMIACAWGALIGGISTPAGCGPNPLTMSFLKDLAGIDFTFWQWMLVGFPAMLLMIPCAWFILLRVFPLEAVDLKISDDEFRRRCAECGRVSKKEAWVLGIFGLTIGLWVFEPLIAHWSGGAIDYLDINFVALTLACTLFFPGINAISWKTAEQKISWGGILLIVSGLSLGMAVYHSGAAEWIAWTAFRSIGALHPALIVFAIVFGVSLMKVGFSSNTVTGTIVVPLLIALAQNLNLDPALLAIPAGITASLAFILVTSTPTNVIPYSSGYFSIGDMAKAGVWMTLASSVCVTISIYVMGKLFGIIAL